MELTSASINEFIDKDNVEYMHHRIQPLKKEEVLSFVTTLIELETIMLSENTKTDTIWSQCGI